MNLMHFDHLHYRSYCPPALTHLPKLLLIEIQKYHICYEWLHTWKHSTRFITFVTKHRTNKVKNVYKRDVNPPDRAHRALTFKLWGQCPSKHLSRSDAGTYVSHVNWHKMELSLWTHNPAMKHQAQINHHRWTYA